LGLFAKKAERCLLKERGGKGGKGKSAGRQKAREEKRRIGGAASGDSR